MAKETQEEKTDTKTDTAVSRKTEEDTFLRKRG